MLPGHERFWITEEAMSEGDPVLALERGEQLDLPPVLCIQGPNDLGHPIGHLERFIHLYRRAGGAIDLEMPDLPEGTNLGFTMEDNPTGRLATDMVARVATFINHNTVS